MKKAGARPAFRNSKFRHESETSGIPTINLVTIVSVNQSYLRPPEVIRLEQIALDVNDVVSFIFIN
jgi:hypothetical protein